MSKYTTELRYIVDNEKLYPPIAGSLSLASVLKSYPLYNEVYTDTITGETINRRDELNEKIINHYYFREIGFETVPRFLFALQRRLNEIMKYYNQMYKSIDVEFNPLWNVDMTETFEHDINGKGSAISTGSNVNSGTNTNSVDSINVESDTPPSEISDNDIKSNMYASRTAHNNNTTSETLGTKNDSNGNVNTTDDKNESYTKHSFGSSAGYTFPQNIQQWRNIMVNVDMLIVDELKDLFMNLW